MIRDIQVRELEKRDLNAICDYWSNATEASLIAMGANIKKMPTRSQFHSMLNHQIELSLKGKNSYALVWEYKGNTIGHSNVNQIIYGSEAKMHLHIWNQNLRKKGLGQNLVQLSIPMFFENLKLKTLYCEPYAENPAPNKTLPKVGFKFVKKYTCTPGSINFRQEVNQYRIKRSEYRDMYFL